MVLIYTHQITNRLSYTVDLLLKQLLGLSYELTEDRDKFLSSEFAKFAYTDTSIPNQLFFESAYFLFENDIHPLNEKPIESRFNEKKLVGYFSTATSSTFPFDIFASAFLLVSRYEEYLAHQKDEHHRFHASNSLAYRDGFLKSPMVNYYALAIAQKLKEKFPAIEFKQSTFEYISTIDVDMAYCFLHKGFRRNIGGLLKDILNEKYASINTRIKVLLRKQKDPFDTFDYLQNVQEKFNTKTIFFFLLGDHGQHDKNTSHKLSPFKTLIKKISLRNNIGIHFSYGSHFKQNGYLNEKKRLEEITGNKTAVNRFHFLKFDVSETYSKIIEIGIQADYSMGYASQSGFRASIANSFKYFDLNKNEATTLAIYPFMYMDATLQYYEKFSLPQAKKEVKKLITKTHEVGGTFISIWHNNSLSEQEEWINWRELYEYTQSLAVYLA